MSQGAGRNRVEDVARALEIPAPFAVEEFVAIVARRRGRPIRIGSFPGAGPGVPCGLWVWTHAADYVYYAEETSAYHQRQIVVHEVAHMLLGHGAGTGPEHRMECLMPTVGAGAPSGVFADCSGGAYLSARERDAESLASLIMNREAPRPTRHGPDTTELMIVLDQAWGRGRLRGRLAS